MLKDMTNKGVSKQDFGIFRAFLKQACGIMLGDNKEYLVTSRLNKIMVKNELTSLNELVMKMQRNPRSGLRQQVVDAMTTNETLWFRDSHPFEILKKQIIPEFVKKSKGQTIRIWSSACSSGQEPYSISMIIEEFKLKNPGALSAGGKVVATDISDTMLNAAKKGEYDPLVLGRGLSDERKQRFMDHEGDGSWSVKPLVKSCVEFRPLNLMESYAALGKFDVVFCRNVLIYFTGEDKKSILTKIHGCLKPESYLVLGASESLNDLPDLYEMVQCNPGIIYRVKGKTRSVFPRH